MKKNKRASHLNMIFGINGCLNLLQAKKLEIALIHIMIDGKTDKNNFINQFSEKFAKQITKIDTRERTKEC